MPRQRRIAGLVLPVSALAVTLAGCAAAGPAPAVIVRGVAIREPAVSPVPYGSADAAFGLSVLGAWCAQRPQANIVLSPASLASGLGLAYLGARGSTAAAMARVLRVPAAGAALADGLASRTAALRQLAGPGVAVDQADQVWADPSLPPLRSYLDAAATAYSAGLGRVPLLTDPGRAAQQINAAIAAGTRGGISHLLTARSLQNVDWVLTDALRLHARWARPFDPSLTSPGPFTTASGRRVAAPYLRGGRFASVTADGWTAVELPYQGSRLDMIAMLPDSGSAACPALSAAAALAITSRLSAASADARARVAIALPRISLSDSANLAAMLMTLGMGVAFGPDADFSGLSARAGQIGFVLHAATLRVDASGTVASAATAAGILSTAEPAPLPTVTFDRPYVLMVTDPATGEPLFLARVTDPAES